MQSSDVDILLVEDSQDDMDLALHALRGENLANNIFVVRDGEQALDFLFCREAFAKRSLDHPQTCAARLEVAQGGWNRSPQADQKRSADQDYPRGHNDFLERRAGSREWL